MAEMKTDLKGWVTWSNGVLEGSGQSFSEPVIDEVTGTVTQYIMTDDGRCFIQTTQAAKWPSNVAVPKRKA